MNIIFDRQLLTKNRNKASHSFDSYSFLHQEVGEWIIEKLASINKPFPKILEIGARNGHLGQKILQLKNSQFLMQTDIAADMVKLQPGENKIICDDESLPFEEKSFDLIISNLNLHFINLVPHHLSEIKKLLKPEGLFIASFFGGETLKELRQSFYETEMSHYGGASSRIIPFIDIKTAGMLMQNAGFSCPVADSSNIEVDYPNVQKLLHELKKMGEGNILKDRKPKIITKKLLADLETKYHKLAPAENNHILANFEVITLSGWK